METKCNDNACSSNKLQTLKYVRNYMDMVLTLLAFQRAVRSRDWELRLSALEEFTKYVFSMNMRNYSTLCAWHVAEMKFLKKSDTETWSNIRSQWAPNKCEIPFCHLGSDEALEQENRKMKVTGGVVGITQNA